MNSYSLYDSPFIEISKNNLLHNFKLIVQRSGGIENVLAVVKDDAYGCGAVEVAKVLEENGAWGFVVARFIEAKVLRNAGVKSEIIVLGKISRDEISEALSLNIGLTVNDISDFEILENFKRESLLHLNIDTGMSRMGISKCDIPNLISLAKKIGITKFRSIFSHIATADVPKSVKAIKQMNIFDKLLLELKSNGLRYDFSHLSNSAGIINFSDEILKHKVRVGVSLYGVKVDPNYNNSLGFKQIMSVKVKVAKIRKLSIGDSVSYGANFTAESETNIAVLPIGYAHGYLRSQSCGVGKVLIKGKYYSVIGNVTMDYTMVDIGFDDIAVGDIATITDAENITADDIAVACGTIGYEIICNFGLRNCQRELV